MAKGKPPYGKRKVGKKTSHLNQQLRDERVQLVDAICSTVLAHTSRIGAPLKIRVEYPKR